METGQETKDTMEAAGTKEKEEMKSTSEETKGTENKGSSIRQEYIFAADVKLKECRFCRVMIPKKARICPNCKMYLKNRWFLKTVAALFAIAVIGAGSYWLSAYWGLTDGALLPGWAVRNSVTVPAVSVATGTTQAGTVTVEAADVAAITVTSVAQKEDDTAGTSGIDTERDAAQTDTVTTAEESVAGKDPAKEEGSTGQNAEEDNSGAGTDTDGAAEKEPVNPEADAQKAAEEDTDGKETDTAEKSGKSTDADADRMGTADNTPTGTDADSAGIATKDSGESAAIVNEMPEGTEKAGTLKEDETALNGSALLDGMEEMDEQEAAFRAECERIDYKKLLREQEEYLGAAVMAEAEVVCQVDGGLFDDNVYYLCVEEDYDGNERYYIIRDDRETDDTLILEGDRVVIYGNLFGRCKIPANLIETRPIVPAISMAAYDLLEE